LLRSVGADPAVYTVRVPGRRSSIALVSCPSVDGMWSVFRRWRSAAASETTGESFKYEGGKLWMAPDKSPERRARSRRISHLGKFIKAIIPDNREEDVEVCYQSGRVYIQGKRCAWCSTSGEICFFLSALQAAGVNLNEPDLKKAYSEFQ